VRGSSGELSVYGKYLLFGRKTARWEFASGLQTFIEASESR